MAHFPLKLKYHSHHFYIAVKCDLLFKNGQIKHFQNYRGGTHNSRIDEIRKRPYKFDFVFLPPFFSFSTFPPFFVYATPWLSLAYANIFYGLHSEKEQLKIYALTNLKWPLHEGCKLIFKIKDMKIITFVPFDPSLISPRVLRHTLFRNLAPPPWCF